MDSRYSHVKELIELNRRAHDLVAEEYDANHTEIFNPTEQKRINIFLQDAISYINTGSKRKKALDFGSGTGNLTRHFLELGLEVTSADLSIGCLSKISKEFLGNCLFDTLLLNGTDLNNIEDDLFDVVATYSVLHHIPDYLKLVEELVRVTKPGGLIIIDHEVCPSYWHYDNKYLTYLGELGEKFYSDHMYELGLKPEGMGKRCSAILLLRRKIFSISAWIMLFKNFKRNKKKVIGPDGDIHVYLDDHIEWNEIKILLESNCDILKYEDYLVCREVTDPPNVWPSWCNKVSDMRFIIARRRLDNSYK